MGKVYAGLDDRLRQFISAQHVFFVATAPSAGDGHINLSPKGHRDTFAGLVVTGPIPVFNRRQGEIAQRRADLARAQADLRSVEADVTLAVKAALARLAEARKWADEYPAEVLPNLERARQDLERLFAQNEPGVDVLRVNGVRQRLLKARDLYLDALFELGQARADLAAAVGDPALALIEPPSPPKKDGP